MRRLHATSLALALLAALLFAGARSESFGGAGAPEAPEEPIGGEDAAGASEENGAPPVLYYYYGWYGAGAEGRHWPYGTTDLPLAGYYDSHSLEDTRQQLVTIREQGRGSGIVMSWWGSRSYEDESLAVALDVAGRERLNVTASFETWSTGFREASAEDLAREMEHVWTTHAQHPAWLRVDGKPVLFVHAACLHSVEKWSRAFRILDEKGIKFYAYGEIRKEEDAALFAVFDALYYFMPIELARDGVYERANADMRARADANGREWLPTVVVGYDNRNDAILRHRLLVDDRGGAILRETWSAAAALDPRFLLLATWNEWHEGTTFEPGVEDQGRRLAIVRELHAAWDEVR